ncbi:hypothetical protein L0P51_05890 [Acetatifactor sp. DFI.5.50]|nr:hypothetical protein [Acetatifactor sp. DFI.5.50]
MEKVIKSYKGFNKDMTCRGFQYEEGKEYEEETADACHSGFHACEYPLDCLGYYSPNESVYHEVEQNGEFDRGEDDSKVASTKIKIGARLDISGLVKAAIDFTMSRVKKEAESDEDYGASSATGYKGASSATGDYGASSATGNCGASSATGNCGASSATGYKGASSATGDYGASSATGNCGASSATGNCGASSATGYKGASSANDSESVAVAWGYKGKAMGVLGSHIVLAEWKYIGKEDDDRYDRSEQKAWEFVGAKMFRVDGEKVKPDTWYRLENGELVEVEDAD